MTRPTLPQPATVFAGLLAAPSVGFAEVLAVVSEAFGPVTVVSEDIRFDQAWYYEREMGPGITRRFVGFEGMRDPGNLAQIKLLSNELELRWSVAGRRGVNLDPGLLDLGHVVLASCKPAGHRVYLGDGVYAEVEYLFQHGCYRPVPWTYPDYREQSAVAFFNELRRRHKEAQGPRPARGDPRSGG